MPLINNTYLPSFCYFVCSSALDSNRRQKLSFGIRLLPDDPDVGLSLFKVRTKLSGGKRSFLSFSVSGDGGLVAELDSNDTVVARTPFPVADGKWHRVSLAFQGEHGFKISWDGSNDEQSQISGGGQSGGKNFSFVPNSRIEFGEK